VTILLLRSVYTPQPLVHPILLGRQSDVARVRFPGESAVYRNYGTGMMGRVRELSVVLSPFCKLTRILVSNASWKGRKHFIRSLKV
jgi:hypothetical protein